MDIYICTVSLIQLLLGGNSRSSRCEGSPWLRKVCVLDVVIAFEAEADADACDVTEVEGVVPDDDPSEYCELRRLWPWALLLYLEPGAPGRVGSSSVLCFLERMMTTRFMSGRSRGSACTHSSPMRMHSSTCSGTADGFTAGSSSSRLRSFLCSFHAYTRARSNTTND